MVTGRGHDLDPLAAWGRLAPEVRAAIVALLDPVDPNRAVGHDDDHGPGHRVIAGRAGGSGAG